MGRARPGFILDEPKRGLSIGGGIAPAFLQQGAHLVKNCFTLAAEILTALLIFALGFALLAT